ncbi:MAG: DUF5686 and carboxypeptidase regulatory-like domain-containing protein [Bacteroidota bacterium]
MKKQYSFTLAALLFTLLSHAAGIKGTISNEAGEALAYASIFVEETGSGTTTNTEGKYEIELAEGEYTISFQYLGYKTETRRVVISGQQKSVLDVVLSLYVLELKGVEIKEGREDPAYTIMRKAIAKASYHLEQVETYTATIYTKGTVGSLKAPKIIDKYIDKAMEKEGVDSIAFISESVSNITYRRPNFFKEEVIHIREQGERQVLSPPGYISGSFYQPNIANAVSPLAPRAMSYYRFEFLGSHLEQGVEVNEIKVSARSPGEGVFEGTISIVEDSWNIYNLDLTTYQLGFVINIKQFYQLIQEKAWLPTMQQLEMDIKTLGFGLRFDYITTVSNYDISLNPDLNVNFEVIDESLVTDAAPKKRNKEAVKSGDLEEALASGEELNRKDLRKLMKAYRKEARAQQEDKNLDRIEEMQIDSSAYNRDTTFWDSVRSVPLTDYEKESYRIADSIAIAQETTEEESESVEKSSQFGAFDLIFGGNYRVSEKVRFFYESPLLSLNFNTVEGYHIGTDLGLRFQPTNKNQLQIGFIPRFSFAQDRFRYMYYLDGQFGKSDRRTDFRLEGGTFIEQLNKNEPIDPYVNAFYTLLLRENYMKIFEQSYWRIDIEQQVSDKVSLDFSVESADRSPLQNSENARPWTGSREDFTSNTPFNTEIGTANFESHVVLNLAIGIEWKPWQRYDLKDSEKVFSNRGPTFFSNYRKGTRDADYDFLEAGMKYNWNRWDGSQFDFKITLGRFLNDAQVFFPDFRHFLGNQTIFVTADPVESFRLLPYYEFSTKEEFVELHAQYQFRKLAITQLPVVWMLGLKENLFASYLYTPSTDNYLEVGYGVDNIFKIFRIEAVASFQDFEYQDFGIRLGISSALGRSVFSVRRSD